MARLRQVLPGVLQEVAELAYNIPAYLRLRQAWRTFRPDLVYERCNLFYLAGAWLARRQGALLYLEVNSPLALERARFAGLRLKQFAAMLERFTWRSATRVLPVTGVLGLVVQDGGVAPERICVVPNGIVLDRFATVPDREARDQVVLGFVGFMRAWHGLDLVIDALARELQAVTLVVIGDGPVRPDLERQAAALGIADRVQFKGLVPHEEVPASVSRFDIALQPRVTEYASPLKIFDYMAAGCAILAPDQPNIREILTHEETALLFDPASPGSLVATLRRLTQDAALRRRLGQAAREQLETRNYTWEHNAQRIVAWAAEDSRRHVPATTKAVAAQS